MSLDYQQVRQQARQLAELAQRRQGSVLENRQRASEHLAEFANEQQALRDKVRRVASHYDPSLRCAMPPDPQLVPAEALNAAHPLPALPEQATILAADGSQIPVDRHAEVLYCLVNVGAIQLCLGKVDTPRPVVRSRLLYDDDIFINNRLLSDGALALMRDQAERTILAELAQTADPPVITFTDGPVELWGVHEREFPDASTYLDSYLDALRRLAKLDATVAGYVEKPTANLVVRLLEVALTPDSELKGIKEYFPLRRATDLDLFSNLLAPGARSAVFEFQSMQARQYRDALALHFFYLNVGREKHPWLARVEIPAWVAADARKLDNLHAVLVDQCRRMGQPYPYLLHRAHETALVSLDEREQVTQMIALELRNRQVEVGERSYKQSGKELPGRSRYP
jgi:hypothetical protein